MSDEIIAWLAFGVLAVVVGWLLFKAGELHAMQTAWDKDMEQRRQDQRTREIAIDVLQSHMRNQHEKNGGD